MNYFEAEKILLSYGLEKYTISEGTNFRYIKGKKHKVILERLKPLSQGGVRGFLYVKVLEDYKDRCSKNGHINIKDLSEAQLKSILERLINYYDKIY